MKQIVNKKIAQSLVNILRNVNEWLEHTRQKIHTVLWLKLNIWRTQKLDEFFFYYLFLCWFDIVRHMYKYVQGNKQGENIQQTRRKTNKLHYTNSDSNKFDCVNNVNLDNDVKHKNKKKYRTSIKNKDRESTKPCLYSFSFLCVTTWLPMIAWTWIIIFHTTISYGYHRCFHFYEKEKSEFFLSLDVWLLLPSRLGGGALVFRNNNRT